MRKLGDGRSSHDKRRKDIDPARYWGDGGVHAGDIMVTAVGDLFVIGRLKADRSAQEPLGTDGTCARALQRACALAGARHRVFVCARACDKTYTCFDCGERPE